MIGALRILCSTAQLILFMHFLRAGHHKFFIQNVICAIFKLLIMSFYAYLCLSIS